MPSRRTLLRTSLAALAVAPIGATVARADDPNNKSIPAWPAYTSDKRTTMVLNDTCAAEADPDGEVRPIWSRIATA